MKNTSFSSDREIRDYIDRKYSIHDKNFDLYVDFYTELPNSLKESEKLLNKRIEELKQVESKYHYNGIKRDVNRLIEYTNYLNNINYEI